jgi:hypothetical protein
VALGSDIRYSLRSLVRSPLLTATLVLTVAIGAGGNGAIFGFVGGLIAHGAASPDPADAGRFGRVAVLLLFASAVVLLLACATVAGLLLSRASARTLETAVKVAIGATRRRLARQCLIDSLIVALAGGALGVLFAWWTAHLFPLLFFAEDAEQLALAPDVRWLATAAGVWIVVMVVCGMVPVFAVPQRDPSLVLRRDASLTSNSSRRLRIRMVLAQIALCSVLIVVAGVIREDLRSSIRSSRGRTIGSLLVATFKAYQPEYLDLIETKARALPEVTSAGWISTLPSFRAASQGFTIEQADLPWREIRLDVATFAPDDRHPEWLRVDAGRMFGVRDTPGGCRVALVNQAAAAAYFGGQPVGRAVEDAVGTGAQIIGVLAPSPIDHGARPTLFYYDGQTGARSGVDRDRLFRARQVNGSAPIATMDANIASPQYFELFADPPIAGRAFAGADHGGACRVGVVNEDAARTVFAGQAVGAAVIDGWGDRIEIVGVVKAEALGAARRAAAPTILMPRAQMHKLVMTLAFRANDTSEAFRSQATSALSVAGIGERLSAVSTLEQHLERTSLASAQIASTLVGVLAALALVLSLAGIYGVMADLVVRRRRELALRVALGANGWQLIGNVMREGLRLAVTGGAAGLVLAVAGTPLLDRFVVRPQLPGPPVVAGATGVILMLVLLACALPAWRAVSVDPKVVMHDE